MRKSYKQLTAELGPDWVFWDSVMREFFWEKDEHDSVSILWMNSLQRVKTVAPTPVFMVPPLTTEGDCLWTY